MKTIALLSAVCVATLTGNAQPFTGITTYNHSNISAALSSGCTTSVHSNGFLMGSYRQVTTAGGFNLFIDKADQNADFLGTTEFRQAYQFSDNPNCTSALSQELNCYGISVIETNLITNTNWYAMAAAFDLGCAFATLDNMGNPTFTDMYQFPTTATQITKPLITESLAYPSTYYVCGSYLDAGTRYMYLLQVNNSGSINWSNTYDLITLGVTTSLEPKAIVESPFQPMTQPMLVIAGIADPNDATLMREGFIMRVNGNNITGGGVTQFQLYGSSNATNEGFHSIRPVFLSNQQAFLLGGYTDTNPAAGYSWMALINNTGSVNWSSQVLTSTPGADAVVDAIHRLSSTYGDEYYGVTPTSAGSGVIKLDNTGAAFGPSASEFLYNPASTITEPAAISFLDINGSSINDGIHVYGTTAQVSGGAAGDTYLVQAYFNGTAGNCLAPNPQFTTALSAVNPGPSNIPSFPNAANVTSSAGPPSCTGHSLASMSNFYTPFFLCPTPGLPGPPYSGSNARPAVSTGIAAHTSSDSRISMQPNPFQDKLTINYTANSKEEVSIQVLNSLGQLIHTSTQSAETGKNSLTIDFNTLNAESGIYFITTTLKGGSSTQKVVFCK